ncbi:toxin glutamine deamidase domain-containing protein [Actinokineospora sp. 24-640]
MIPDDVRTLFQILTGEEWPDANEDHLRALAAAWEEAGTSIGGLHGALRKLVTAVREGFDGEAETAFADRVAPFVDNGHMAAAEERFLALAVFLRNLALDVEYVKLVSVITLVTLAAEIAWATAMAYFSGGATMAWLAGRVAAVRTILDSLLGRLLANFAQAAAFGVVFQVGVDALAQSIQFIRGDRDSWNTQYTVNAIGVGLTGAVIAAPIMAAGRQATKSITSVLDTALGPAAWHKKVVDAVVDTTVEGVQETAAETLYQGITTGEWTVNPYSFTSGAVSGLAGIGGTAFGFHLLGKFPRSPLSDRPPAYTDDRPPAYTETIPGPHLPPAVPPIRPGENPPGYTETDPSSSIVDNNLPVDSQTATLPGEHDVTMPVGHESTAVPVFAQPIAQPKNTVADPSPTGHPKNPATPRGGESHTSRPSTTADPATPTHTTPIQHTPVQHTQSDPGTTSPHRQDTGQTAENPTPTAAPAATKPATTPTQPPFQTALTTTSHPTPTPSTPQATTPTTPAPSTATSTATSPSSTSASSTSPPTSATVAASASTATSTPNTVASPSTASPSAASSSTTPSSTATSQSTASTAAKGGIPSTVPTATATTSPTTPSPSLDTTRQATAQAQAGASSGVRGPAAPRTGAGARRGAKRPRPDDPENGTPDGGERTSAPEPERLLPPTGPETGALLARVPQGKRFTDPRAWHDKVNGAPGQPGRDTNCVDVALAVHQTYALGKPRVAGRAVPRSGTPTRRNPTGQLTKAAETLGHDWELIGDGRTGLAALITRLGAAGHGASALVTGVTPGDPDGAHTANLVNHDGVVLLVDAQNGLAAEVTPDDVPAVPNPAEPDFLSRAAGWERLHTIAFDPTGRHISLGTTVPGGPSTRTFPAGYVTDSAGAPPAATSQQAQVTGHGLTGLLAVARHVAGRGFGARVLVTGRGMGGEPREWIAVRVRGREGVVFLDPETYAEVDVTAAAVGLGEVRMSLLPPAVRAVPGLTVPGTTAFTETSHTPGASAGAAVVMALPPNGGRLRFPQPDPAWLGAVNAVNDRSGNANAGDSAWAFHDIWFEWPRAAGRPHPRGTGAPSERAERYPLGYAGRGATGMGEVAWQVLTAGHGAAAVVVHTDGGGRDHAWNVVNHNNTVYWVNAQTGTVDVLDPTTGTSPGSDTGALGHIWALLVDDTNKPVPFGTDQPDDTTPTTGRTIPRAHGLLGTDPSIPLVVPVPGNGGPSSSAPPPARPPQAPEPPPVMVNGQQTRVELQWTEIRTTTRDLHAIDLSGSQWVGDRVQWITPLAERVLEERGKGSLDKSPAEKDNILQMEVQAPWVDALDPGRTRPLRLYLEKGPDGRYLVATTGHGTVEMTAEQLAAYLLAHPGFAAATGGPVRPPLVVITREPPKPAAAAPAASPAGVDAMDVDSTPSTATPDDAASIVSPDVEPNVALIDALSGNGSKWDAYHYSGEVGMRVEGVLVFRGDTWEGILQRRVRRDEVERVTTGSTLAFPSGDGPWSQEALTDLAAALDTSPTHPGLPGGARPLYVIIPGDGHTVRITTTDGRTVEVDGSWFYGAIFNHPAFDEVKSGSRPLVVLTPSGADGTGLGKVAADFVKDMREVFHMPIHIQVGAKPPAEALADPTTEFRAVAGWQGGGLRFAKASDSDSITRAVALRSPGDEKFIRFLPQWTAATDPTKLGTTAVSAHHLADTPFKETENPPVFVFVRRKDGKYLIQDRDKVEYAVDADELFAELRDAGLFNQVFDDHDTSPTDKPGGHEPAILFIPVDEYAPDDSAAADGEVSDDEMSDYELSAGPGGGDESAYIGVMTSRGGFADAEKLRSAVKGAGYHRTVFWPSGWFQIVPGGTLVSATGAFPSLKPPRITVDDVLRYPAESAKRGTIGEYLPTQDFDTVSFPHASWANTRNSHRFYVVQHERKLDDGQVLVQQVLALSPVHEERRWHAGAHGHPSGLGASLIAPGGKAGDRVELSGPSAVEAFSSETYRKAHPGAAAPLLLEVCSSNKPVKGAGTPSQADRLHGMWNVRHSDKPVPKTAGASEVLMVWDQSHTYEVDAGGTLDTVKPPGAPRDHPIWLGNLAADAVPGARARFNPDPAGTSLADVKEFAATVTLAAQAAAWRTMRGTPLPAITLTFPAGPVSQTRQTVLGALFHRVFLSEAAKLARYGLPFDPASVSVTAVQSPDVPADEVAITVDVTPVHTDAHTVQHGDMYDVAALFGQPGEDDPPPMAVTGKVPSRARLREWIKEPASPDADDAGTTGAGPAGAGPAGASQSAPGGQPAPGGQTRGKALSGSSTTGAPPGPAPRPTTAPGDPVGIPSELGRRGPEAQGAAPVQAPPAPTVPGLSVPGWTEFTESPRDPGPDAALGVTMALPTNGGHLRFAQPEPGWVHAVNAGAAGRDANAGDAAWAFHDTWFGRPRAAGRPHPADTDPPSRRAARHPLAYVGAGPAGMGALARHLLDAGHGAAAVVTHIGESRRPQAWNLVNHNGTVHWVNAQTGALETLDPATGVGQRSGARATGEVWALAVDGAHTPLPVGPPLADLMDIDTGPTGRDAPAGPVSDSHDRTQPLSRMDDAARFPAAWGKGKAPVERLRQQAARIVSSAVGSAGAADTVVSAMVELVAYRLHQIESGHLPADHTAEALAAVLVAEHNAATTPVDQPAALSSGRPAPVAEAPAVTVGGQQVVVDPVWTRIANTEGADHGFDLTGDQWAADAVHWITPHAEGVVEQRESGPVSAPADAKTQTEVRAPWARGPGADGTRPVRLFLRVAADGRFEVATRGHGTVLMTPEQLAGYIAASPEFAAATAGAVRPAVIVVTRTGANPPADNKHNTRLITALDQRLGPSEAYHYSGDVAMRPEGVLVFSQYSWMLVEHRPLPTGSVESVVGDDIMAFPTDRPGWTRPELDALADSLSGDAEPDGPWGDGKPFYIVVPEGFAGVDGEWFYRALRDHRLLAGLGRSGRPIVFLSPSDGPRPGKVAMDFAKKLREGFSMPVYLQTGPESPAEAVARAGSSGSSPNGGFEKIESWQAGGIAARVAEDEDGFPRSFVLRSPGDDTFARHIARWSKAGTKESLGSIAVDGTAPVDTPWKDAAVPPVFFFVRRVNGEYLVQDHDGRTHLVDAKGLVATLRAKGAFKTMLSEHGGNATTSAAGHEPSVVFVPVDYMFHDDPAASDVPMSDDSMSDGQLSDDDDLSGGDSSDDGGGTTDGVSADGMSAVAMASAGGLPAADVREIANGIKAEGFYRTTHWPEGWFRTMPDGTVASLTGAFATQGPPKLTADDVVRHPYTSAATGVFGEFTPSQDFDSVVFAHSAWAATKNSNRYYMVTTSTWKDGSGVERSTSIPVLSPIAGGKWWYIGAHGARDGYSVTMKAPDGEAGDRVDVPGEEGAAIFYGSALYQREHPLEGPSLVMEMCAVDQASSRPGAPTSAYLIQQGWNTDNPDKPVKKSVGASADLIVQPETQTYSVVDGGTLNEIRPGGGTDATIPLAALAANQVPGSRVRFGQGTADLPSSDVAALLALAQRTALVAAWRTMRGTPGPSVTVTFPSAGHASQERVDALMTVFTAGLRAEAERMARHDLPFDPAAIPVRFQSRTEGVPTDEVALDVAVTPIPGDLHTVWHGTTVEIAALFGTPGEDVPPPMAVAGRKPPVLRMRHGRPDAGTRSSTTGTAASALVDGRRGRADLTPAVEQAFTEKPAAPDPDQAVPITTAVRPGQRFTHPDRFARLVNPQAPKNRHRVNQGDAAVAFADTWFGTPRAAGTPTDPDSPGRRMLAHGLRFAGTGRTALREVVAAVRRAGPGAAAILVNYPENGLAARGHGAAWNVVNHDGTVLVVNPRTGQIVSAGGEEASAAVMPGRVHAVVVGPDGARVGGADIPSALGRRGAPAAERARSGDEETAASLRRWSAETVRVRAELTAGRPSDLDGVRLTPAREAVLASGPNLTATDAATTATRLGLPVVALVVGPDAEEPREYWFPPKGRPLPRKVEEL